MSGPGQQLKDKNKEKTRCRADRSWSIGEFRAAGCLRKLDVWSVAKPSSARSGCSVPRKFVDLVFSNVEGIVNFRVSPHWKATSAKSTPPNGRCVDCHVWDVDDRASNTARAGAYGNEPRAEVPKGGAALQ